MTLLVQHELFPEHTGISPEELRLRLTEDAAGPVDVRITCNRVAMASVRFDNGSAIRVRVHEGFLRAPPAVLASLGNYVRDRRPEDWAAVAEYARGIVSARATRPARRTKPVVAGRVYDLREIRNEVNRSCFNGSVSCGIEWGRKREKGAARRASRSVRFGSWDAADRVVRVHPILDDPRVPPEFLRYIVFHEMLHAVVPDTRHGGRRCYHSPTFRALERTFPNWQEMQQLAASLVRRLA